MSNEKFGRSIPLSYQVVIIVGFMVIFYQLFSLSSSIYNDSSVDDYNSKQRQEIEHMQQERQQKKKLYSLTGRPSFYEKGGKEMNKLNDGEQEIILHDFETEKLMVTNNITKEAEEEKENSGEVPTYVATLPVYKQWLYYFFEVR